MVDVGRIHPADDPPEARKLSKGDRPLAKGGRTFGVVRAPFKEMGVTKRSQASEKKAARDEGGRRVSGSGNRREKGDVRLRRFRLEDKFTDKASITIPLKTLLKIEREAIFTPPCLMPQMRITIQGHVWRMIRDEDYIALNLNDMDDNVEP